MNDTDVCFNMCRSSTCGNGIINGSEQCDDANVNDGDDCLSTCILANCGDGITHLTRSTPVVAGRNALEQCDDANGVQSDDCLGAATAEVALRCQFNAPGDGYLHLTTTAARALEACDDGNLTATDFCNNTGVQQCPTAVPTGFTAAGIGLSGGHCYLTRTTTGTRAASLTACQALAPVVAAGHSQATANLISIGTLVENNFARDLANAAGVATTWIGLGDTGVDPTPLTAEGTYLWSDGSAFSFTNWAAFQPDDTALLHTSNCVDMNGSMGTGYGLWSDDPCSGTRAATCEYVWP